MIIMLINAALFAGFLYGSYCLIKAVCLTSALLYRKLRALKGGL